MKLILIKDVEKLGKKFDVKEVKDGYARNFLIPNGSAKPATKEALAWLEVQKEIEAKRSEEELSKIQEIASAVDGQEVLINVKVGDKDQLFEAVNTQKISDKLKELGFDIKKTQIDLKEPIKEIGDFPIKIKFTHNLESEIRVIVNKEEKEEEE